MIVRRLFVLVLTCACIAQPVQAWNGLGRMEVVAIAREALTPKAKAQVGKLLALNPLYDKWIDTASIEDRDRVAFIKSFQWADVIERLSPYHPDGLPGANGTELTSSAVLRWAAVRMISPDVATLLYRVTYTSAVKGGKAETVKILSSSVYVRRNNKWWSALCQETPIK